MSPKQTDADKRAALFNRPKPEKSHKWITAIWIIGIILLLVVTFTVLYYVLIAPTQAHINQQDSGATSPQSSLSPLSIPTNPTYEVGFFL